MKKIISRISLNDTTLNFDVGQKQPNKILIIQLIFFFSLCMFIVYAYIKLFEREREREREILDGVKLKK